jgi:hypothetical protein
MIFGDVILGGFVFQDHEIPDKIAFGGQQSHKIHDTIGNGRVVDAMGPKPGDKAWSGRFRGAGAIARAQALEAMAVAGGAVSLTWFGLSFTVLIVDFQADTEKFFEVPYSIKCVTVDDPAQDGGGFAASLDSLVGGDLSSALSIATGAASSVTGALSSLSGAIAAIPQLQGSTASVLAPALLSAQSAASTINSLIAANDPALNVASPDGADPAALATWLAGSASSMVAQSGLADAAGFVSRIALNLTLAN